ncbi:MAG: hypothetical protein HZA29_02985 [Candidatus Omnitrophica bacterium]|nr:hypothetical protein [Candidatus Omnitrophota bacterium]
MGKFNIFVISIAPSLTMLSGCRVSGSFTDAQKKPGKKGQNKKNNRQKKYDRSAQGRVGWITSRPAETNAAGASRFAQGANTAGQKKRDKVSLFTPAHRVNPSFSARK